ncbi:hypothetical protein KAI87_09665, partial [Myxococcota bacterium]|nr:hypothetical protein [Myxococcota bacterium]
MKILMRLNIGILGGITAGIIAIALLGACEEIIEPGDCAPPTILDEANNACVMPQSSCDPDAPTSIADECVAAHRLCQELAGEALCGVCEPSHIEVDGECVLLSTCEGLDCAAQKRECVTIDDTVSAYCGECVEGSVDLGGSCVTQSCDEHTPASIGAACDSAFRVCTESATGAVCGGCFEYYVEQNDFCLPVQRCVDLGCLDAHRFCVEALSHTDAACVECKVGYVEENGVCLLDESATCVADVAGSILDGCAAENRNCVTLSGVSSCSGCKSGFVENEALATCELPATCSELSCDTLNRSCEEIPNGHCVGCLPDFIEDEATLLCRPVLVCDDMSCSDGDECAAATQESDAFCRKECAGNALWSGSRCVQCPPCDAEGEVGPWPWPTATGACICQTEPGYYYSLSADVGPFKCDSDGDGWLRESARISLESSDAALLANAR